MSSSAVSGSGPVAKLDYDSVCSVMKFLPLTDLCSAKRTCRLWRDTVERSTTNTILNRSLIQNEFSLASRYIMHAPLRISQAIYNEVLRHELGLGWIMPPHKPKHLTVLQIIAEYAAPERSEVVDGGSKRICLERRYGDLGWRSAGVDPGIVPSPPRIPHEPLSFNARQNVVFFPETLNGEVPCIDVLEKIHCKATGLKNDVFINDLFPSKDVKQKVRTRPVGISGWHVASIVREHRFGTIEEDLKSLEENGKGRGIWEIATIAQIMALEVLFGISGERFLGNLSLCGDWRKGDTCRQGEFYVVPSSPTSAPSVDCLEGFDIKSRYFVILRKLA